MLGIKALKTSGSDLNLKSVHAAIQSHWSQSKGLGLGPRAYHLQPCDLGQTPRCSRLPFHKLKMIIILSFRVGLQELKYNDTMYVKQLTAQWHREGIDKKTIFIVVPILHNNWQNLRGHLQTGLSQEQRDFTTSRLAVGLALQRIIPTEQNVELAIRQTTLKSNWSNYQLKSVF